MYFNSCKLIWKGHGKLLIKVHQSHNKNDLTNEFKVDDKYVTDNKVVANTYVILLNIYFANIGKEIAQHNNDLNTYYHCFYSSFRNNWYWTNRRLKNKYSLVPETSDSKVPYLDNKLNVKWIWHQITKTK